MKIPNGAAGLAPNCSFETQMGQDASKFVMINRRGQIDIQYYKSFPEVQIMRGSEICFSYQLLNAGLKHRHKTRQGSKDIIKCPKPNSELLKNIFIDPSNSDTHDQKVCKELKAITTAIMTNT